MIGFIRTMHEEFEKDMVIAFSMVVLLGIIVYLLSGMYS